MKHNWVKNPNWPGANQLAIYKHGGGFELGTTVNKSSLWSGRDLNTGASELQDQRSNHSATRLLIATAVSHTPGITHGYSKVVDNKEEGGEAQTLVIKKANSHISPTL